MDRIIAKNFTYGSITAISQKQFDIHLELYNGYINKINEIWTLLQQDVSLKKGANPTYSYYRGIKSGETYALNGVILHELYFNNLGGINTNPSQKIINLINSSFGSFENWLNDFTACGKAAHGWAILAFDPRDRSLHDFMCDAHDQGGVWTAYPIIVMDVYEHAYYVDYPNKKDIYIENFIKDINWNTIDKRIM